MKYLFGLLGILLFYIIAFSILPDAIDKELKFRENVQNQYLTQAQREAVIERGKND